jgi:hypothetical protein
MSDELHSALFGGRVVHRRHAPRPHAFRYGVQMLLLDLGELERVFHGRWLWSTRRPAPIRWRRSDHLGDADRPLDECVRELVERQSGRRPGGPIQLLTVPRHFGYGFNPVSFFYCWDQRRHELEAIVAEVSNTPWKERHPYVLDARRAERDSAGRLRWRFGKAFHVSPFLPMGMDYDWRFAPPAESIGVHMENWMSGELVFDATLSLRRVPITARSLAGALARRPLMSVQVMAAIHWQALRLWLKRTPFHEHPKWKMQRSGTTR